MIPVPAVAVISFLSGISQLDLDRALRCVDARAHHLALLAADLPVAKVAEPSRAKLSDAGVADALAAAERKLEPRLLACHEDRLRPIRLRLGAAGGEDDPAALALLRQSQLGLEALHVKPLEIRLRLPVVGERVRSEEHTSELQSHVNLV